MNANTLKDSVSNAKNTADDVAEKAAQMGRNVRDGAREAFDDARNVGQSAAEKMKSQAAEAAAAAEDRLDDLSEAAQSGFRSAKSTLADGGDRLARALHDAADGTRAVSSRMADAVATGVSEVADHLNVNSVNDLVASTKAYARRHPGTVAAGAAVLGFAFAHFVQSQTRNRGRRG